MNNGSNYPKMSPSDRAKQFLPFAALKGYEEALRAKEKEVEACSTPRNERIYDDINAEEPDTP